jgi:metallo-beta-lactamase class B
MIKNIGFLIFISLFGLLTTMAQPQKNILIGDDIQLIHLQDSVYVHVTWYHLDNFGRFSSNGLILIKDGQALMIDTPMDNVMTERLARFLKDSLSVSVTRLITGHFHDDCLGGLEYLQSIGVESIANSRTIAKCEVLDLPIPSTSFTDSLTFDFNGVQIDCQYFGAGHSFDNITVWIPGNKILFGGCLVKSMDSKGLGNLSDAIVSDWDITIKKVMKRYSVFKIVIPGHGDIGGTELLTHTIELVEKEKAK